MLGLSNANHLSIVFRHTQPQHHTNHIFFKINLLLAQTFAILGY